MKCARQSYSGFEKYESHSSLNLAACTRASILQHSCSHNLSRLICMVRSSKASSLHALQTHLDESGTVTAKTRHSLA